MTYVDELLAKGETVVRRERQHWILPFYIAGRWVAIAIAVFAFGLILNVWIIPNGGDGFLGGLVGFVNTIVTLVTWIALIIAVVGFVVSIVRWRTQEYVLTNQRVIHVSGLVARRSSDSSLESLSDAKIIVPWLGRALGFGNLYLMTASASGDEQLRCLIDPIAFKKAVMEAKTERTIALNTAGRPAAPAPAPAPAIPAATSAEDVTKTLTALAGLRDSGAITTEEYDAKKQELLDRI
jgi:hypothetical protein